MAITRKAIVDQAKSLEDGLWDVAERLGFQRSPENRDKLLAMASKSMDEHIRLQDEAGEDIPFPWPSREDMLASCLSSLVYIIDNSRVSDETLIELCSTNYFIGLLSGDTGSAFASTSFSAVKMHAAALAKLRHAENYAMVDDALKHWRDNISPSLSAQKAAEELIRARVVNLSHKKLAEIISAEKKKQS